MPHSSMVPVSILNSGYCLCRFSQFSLSPCGFYLISQKHAGRWIDDAKLPIGVNESVN